MMRLNKVLVVTALLVAVLAFAGCVTITGDETATDTSTTSNPVPSTTVGVAPRVGYMAPGFELENLDGQTVSLESLRGRYVMLNFWATWCGPCRYEIPFIQEVYEDPAWSDSEVIIAAVNYGESAALVEEFMEFFGLDFMVLLDSDELTARAYNISGIPTTFFIDKDGIIKDIKLGPFRNRMEIEEKLQNLVEE
jgi:thiol-disulfide isomerase/thioredoxin